MLQWQSAPLIEREAEFALLTRALDGAADGRGQVLLITGEPGIGKTRLLQELQRHAANSGIPLLRGKFRSASVPTPLEPFREALEGYFQLDKDDDSDQRMAKVRRIMQEIAPDLLDALIPVIGKFLAIGLKVAMGVAERGPVSRIDQEPGQSLHDLRRTFCAIGRQPTLLTLDDLQWADNASLDLLHALAYHMDQTRVLVVTACRREALARSLASDGPRLPMVVEELEHDGVLTQVDLGRLSKDGVTQLVRNVLECRAVSEQAADDLYDRTQGVPFSLVSVGQALWSERRPETLSELPAAPLVDKEKGVVWGRLRGLSADDLAALNYAAIIGEQFSYDLWEAVLPAPGLPDTLTRLLKRDLVREDPAQDGRFYFSHYNIRQYVYEEMHQPLRARLHREVAAKLEEVYASRLHEVAGTLADHYIQARRFEQAFPHIHVAARKALAEGALKDALAHCRIALRHLPAGNKVPQRAYILQIQGEAQSKVGQYEEAEQSASEALEIGRALQDDQVQAEAHLLLAILAGYDALYAEQMQHLEQSLALFQRAQDRRGTMRTLQWIGDAWEYMGDWEKAAQCYNQALLLAEELDDPAPTAELKAYIGYYHYIRGEWADGLRWLQEAGDIWKKLGDMHSLHKMALYWSCLVYQDRGEHETAIGILQRVEEFEKQNRPAVRPAVYLALGCSHHRLGHWPEAQRCFEQAIANSQEESSEILADVLGSYGEALAGQGEFVRAVEYCERGLEIANREEYVELIAMISQSLGIVYDKMGNWGAARLYLEEAVGIAERLGARKLLADNLYHLGRALRQQGAAEESSRRHEQARQIYEQLGDRRMLEQMRQAREV